MSTAIPSTTGYVAVYSGVSRGDGERLIGIQVESSEGSRPPGLGSALLTQREVLAFALELLGRCDEDVLAEGLGGLELALQKVRS